ncbi:MAG: ABC transporter permease [Planctomycetota bacterium]
MRFLALLGRPVCGVLAYCGDLFGLAGRVTAALTVAGRRGSRVVRRTTVMQVYFTGLEGLGMVASLAVLIGVAMAATIPQRELLVTLLARGYIREVAALITSLVILARSTTAITVELGNMTVAGEIDLLQTLGINPDRHVVVPRVTGVVIASLGLTVVAAAVAPFAAAVFLTVTTADASPASLILAVVDATQIQDVRVVLSKSLLFGGILSLCALREGLHLLPFTTEVPKAVSRAVIKALFLLAVTEVTLLMLTYG